jgi:tRNA 2-thiouridine synthesizing protein A
MMLVIAVKNESDIKNIDIRGKVCPMTFVHTKINLEKMESGEIIDVLLDFAPALDNIPKSCEMQQLAQLISIKEIPNKDKREWIMRLKKL